VGVERIVIDTDVLIFLRKEKMLRRITLFYDVSITWVTLYEFLRGLRYIGKSENEVARMKELLEKLYIILWPSNRTIRTLVNIWCDLRNKGRALDERDLFIGALCIENNLPLWTFNKRHFKMLEEYGLRLFEPKFPNMEIEKF